MATYLDEDFIVINNGNPFEEKNRRMMLRYTFIAHTILDQTVSNTALDGLNESNIRDVHLLSLLENDPVVRVNLTKVPDNTFTQDLNSMSQSGVQPSRGSTPEGGSNQLDSKRKI